MSDTTLEKWCQEAALLLGVPGDVHTTKYPQLLGKEGEIRGTSISAATWDKAKQRISDATKPEDKDRLVLELGQVAKRNEKLFSKLGLTEQELQGFEPVGDKLGQVNTDFRKASNGVNSMAKGTLGSLANVQGMGEENVEEIKEEGRRLQKKFQGAIKKGTPPEQALGALEEYEQFAQGLQAFDSQYSKIRGKYTVLEKGRLTPLEFIGVARIEQLVDDAHKDWIDALAGAEENLRTGDRGRNRGFFAEKVERVKARYAKWKIDWPKLSLYDVLDEQHASGLGGLEEIVSDAWDLASSDEYLAPDEGLNEMKADVIQKWQHFMASTNATQKLARRGPVATEKVRNMNSGRQWKRSYKIGDGLYTLSPSRSADVSFKRPIPKAMRVSSRPDVKSFIYHLAPYAS
jgi:hypothetical protein